MTGGWFLAIILSGGKPCCRNIHSLTKADFTFAQQREMHFTLRTLKFSTRENRDLHSRMGPMALLPDYTTLGAAVLSIRLTTAMVSVAEPENLECDARSIPLRARAVCFFGSLSSHDQGSCTRSSAGPGKRAGFELLFATGLFNKLTCATGICAIASGGNFEQPFARAAPKSSTAHSLQRRRCVTRIL